MENSVNDLFGELKKLAPSTSGKTREESVYKKELYANCVTSDMRKKKRMELRKMRDSFLQNFLQDCKKGTNKEATKSLAERWEKYSKLVYKDAHIICENNTNEETKKMCAEFVSAMEKVLKPAK